MENCGQLLLHGDNILKDVELQNPGVALATFMSTMLIMQIQSVLVKPVDQLTGEQVIYFKKLGSCLLNFPTNDLHHALVI